MKIEEMQGKAHSNAVDKKFWDAEKEIVGIMELSGKFTKEQIKSVVNAFKTQRLALIICEASEADKSMKISTLEGEVTASEGDYIIKGVKGEFYPCKPDIFKETYDIVEE